MTADLVLAEARGWLGTPYHHCQGVKGAGADCAMLLVEIYKAVGLVPQDLDPRPYPPDWHLHRSEERYLGWVERFARPVDRPVPGGVVLWRFGRAYSHGAIVLDEAGTILHAYRPARQVVLGSIHETELAGRPHVFYQMKGL